MRIVPESLTNYPIDAKFNKSYDLSGVYIIKNVKTNKLYVGSSSAVCRRLLEHLKMLKNGRHHAYQFQQEFDEYGIEAFQFRIIEVCGHESLYSRENVWLEHFNSYDSTYNNYSASSGRPTLASQGKEAKSVLKGFRVNDEEMQIFREAAARAGLPLSVWAREKLLEEARRRIMEREKH